MFYINKSNFTFRMKFKKNLFAVINKYGTHFMSQSSHKNFWIHLKKQFKHSYLQNALDLDLGSEKSRPDLYGSF